jgi:hypothetical protein
VLSGGCCLRLQDVCSFLGTLGLPEGSVARLQAAVREEDVDGETLLSMEVLTPAAAAGHLWLAALGPVVLKRVLAGLWRAHRGLAPAAFSCVCGGVQSRHIAPPAAA